jgi:hypothetical protein
MNDKSTITDVLSGNKPIGVEVSISLKSIAMLGAVMVLSAVIIIVARKIFS